MAEKETRKRKSKGKDNLRYKREIGWDEVMKKRKMFKEVIDFAETYKDFLNQARTERECVSYILNLLGNRWRNLEGVRRIRAGQRYYLVSRSKAVALVIVGKRPVVEGLNIVAAHIDSPRLDLKQNPLYEDMDTHLAMLRTHYYGGIKKYHWVSIPLALHGTVVLADGRTVNIAIGEEEGDPVFTVPDLLPHLARDRQMTRKAGDAVKGEDLLILCGSMPVRDKKVKDRVKANVLDILHKKYGIVEEDFISAELEAVPALKSRDVGLDRSMVGGYGQDDRICAFTSVRAITDIRGTPDKTALVLLFDKEEIGSEGNTGAKSMFIEYVIGELLLRQLGEGFNYQHLRRCMRSSRAMSADVNGGVNPIFKDVHEKQNAALIGHGICITKFTGSRGKALSNDAHAEFVGYVRALLNRAKVPWQTGELGKVDEGGGGTVAKFLASHDMEVIDAGPPLLAMHSPFEISSKIDLYASYMAYKTFLSA